MSSYGTASPEAPSLREGRTKGARKMVIAGLAVSAVAACAAVAGYMGHGVGSTSLQQNGLSYIPLPQAGGMGTNKAFLGELWVGNGNCGLHDCCRVEGHMMRDFAHHYSGQDDLWACTASSTEQCNLH